MQPSASSYRTAISAEPGGWAHFGHVKMPDYRWGIFLAEQDSDRVIPAGSRVTRKDDLKMINGLGPFIEEKLNALGIYTFEQIARMTPEMEDEVNEAIEFFPGRVKRDEWVNQAKLLVGSEDPALTDGRKTREEMRKASELVSKAEERKRAQEAAKRPLGFDLGCRVWEPFGRCGGLPRLFCSCFGTFLGCLSR